jgi:endonuclease YncB( thermonuclease family)
MSDSSLSSSLVQFFKVAKEVTLQTFGKDKNGRTIADVLLPDGTNVNHTLVKDGWCWSYKKYSPNDVILEELETRARTARIGLWADPRPVPPWEWQERKDSSGLLENVLEPASERPHIPARIHEPKGTERGTGPSSPFR